MYILWVLTFAQAYLFMYFVGISFEGAFGELVWCLFFERFYD